MQRVLELQANWDERQKLRRFSISRPPVISPPYPIQAPAYSPNLLTTISQPPLEYGRRLGDDEANNAGSNGYSFKMKKDELSEKLHNIKESLEEEIKETKDLLMQKEAKEEKAKLIETALQMMKKDKPDLDENKVKKVNSPLTKFRF